MEELSSRHSVPPCYAGLSITIFVVLSPCLLVAMFLMEAPWRYLSATQALYTIVLCLYIFTIVVDLAVFTLSSTVRIKVRTVVAIMCPVISAILLVPTAAMLMYTKDQGGFTSTSANIALAFSILVVFIAILHIVIASWLYFTYLKKGSCFISSYLPCCICLNAKSPEDTLQLPTAAVEHSDVMVEPNHVFPERLDHFDSVEFNPSEPGLVFNRSHITYPSAGANDNAGMVSFPYVFDENDGVPPTHMVDDGSPGLDNRECVPDPIPAPPPNERAVRSRAQQQQQDKYLLTGPLDDPIISSPTGIDIGFVNENTRNENTRTAGIDIDFVNENTRIIREYQSMEKPEDKENVIPESGDDYLNNDNGETDA